jgi:predicted O-methyltransferase YrrM
MDFIDESLVSFIENHSQQESDVLKRLNRETYAKVLTPRMLAGHLQGRVISMLSNMIQPNQVLEIGTYTGYSAICWTEGLNKNGQLHTIDINEELKDMVDRYIDEAGVDKQVLTYIGNAIEIIPTINEVFDVVFIDADKENYSRYFDLVFDKVKKGGYIIADNVLWSGKVVGDRDKMDVETAALVDYCKKIHQDERVENVLFPIRDGLMIARKL